jgi:hypothetical protein
MQPSQRSTRFKDSDKATDEYQDNMVQLLEEVALTTMGISDKDPQILIGVAQVHGQMAITEAIRALTEALHDLHSHGPER